MRIELHRYTLFAALLIAFAGLVTFVAPTDPDAWWHLRNGQLVWESGVPSRELYSWTAEGRPWLVQEWLTELAMYGVKGAFGYGALSLLFGLFQAAGTAVVYALMRVHGAGRIVSLVLLLFYLVFAAPTWGVRPQVMTPLFLGVFYLVLTLYKRGTLSRRALWGLPVLMALWTNLHASYFMGIALVGAFLVGEAANNLFYKPVKPTPLRPLLLVLGGCLFATLLNPYFIELWTYPLTYVVNGTSNPLLKYTQEWQSPNFHEPVNLFFAVSLVVAALVGIGWRGKREERAGGGRIDVTHAIVAAAFVLLALQAIRLVPLYGLIVLPLLAGSMVRLWPRLSKEGEGRPGRGESIANAVVGVVGVGAMAFFLLSAPQAQTGVEPQTNTGFVYPVGAAEYIAGVEGPVKMYNDFAWGGYLIYRLYPQHKVFIDGRADMYREGIFEDHITLQNTAPGWRETLERYGVNLVVTTLGSPMDYGLGREDAWEVGYRDEVGVVYRGK